MSGDTVVVADLLDHLRAFLEERVVFKYSWQPRLIALWVLGTYLHQVFEYYGYLHITSPTKRCGKSLLLELLGLLGFNGSSLSADPTAALIYRECNRNSSTQIFDEMEKLQADKEKWSAVIAVLNVGFRRGAVVSRVLDPKADTMRDFHVYSPKALASIRHLPDTTADRTIRIELERKRRSEKTKRVGNKAAVAEAARLRDDCHITALRMVDHIVQFYARIDELGVPRELDDRAQSILEPLFAIAALADAESERQSYYAAMLAAAKAIAGIRADTEGDEVNLVAAAKALHARGRDDFAITGSQALDLFKKTDDLRWLDSEAGAKGLLRRLGFRSGTHRKELFIFKPSGDDAEVLRGYRIERARLDDVLGRYDAAAEAPADGASPE